MTTDTRTAPSTPPGRAGQTAATLLGFAALTLIPVAIVTLVALGGGINAEASTAASVLLIVGGSFAGVGPILAAAAVAALPAPPNDPRVRRQVIGWGTASAAVSLTALACVGVAAALEPTFAWLAGSVAVVTLVTTALAVAVGLALRRLIDREVEGAPTPTATELDDLRRRRVRRTVVGAVIGTAVATLGVGALIAFTAGTAGLSAADLLALVLYVVIGAAFGTGFGSARGSFSFARRVQSALGPDLGARTRITKWLVGKSVELDDEQRAHGIAAAPLLLHQQRWAIVQQAALGIGIAATQLATMVNSSRPGTDWFRIGFLVVLVVTWSVLLPLMVRQTRRIRARIAEVTATEPESH